MNVWLFTIGQRLEDAEKTRSFLLARSLIKRGHQIMLWTSAFDHSRKEFRQNRGTIVKLDHNFEVAYLRGIGYKKNISLSRFFDHWVVSKRFPAMARKLARPDLFIISLPDHQLAYQAVKFAGANNIPAIVDVRDTWPDIFLDVTNNELFKTLLKPFIFFENRKVNKLLKSADSIVSMMKTLLDWGLEKAGRSKTPLDEVFYLSTSQLVSRELISTDGLDNRIVEVIRKCEGTMICLFIGTFGSFQNPTLLVEAARYLKEKTGVTNAISFVIGGTGNYFDEIKNRAAGLPNVHFTGWLESKETEVLLGSASVGIIPCNIPANAFPNKAFTYMSGGLPLISCLRGDLADAIEEYGFGLNFQAGNSKDLAEKILQLYNDRSMLNDMAKRSVTFFKERLNSERTYERYAEHAERVAKGCR